MNKILIIEDDPIVARIYRTRLEKEGYTVEICEDGQSGFYRIHEFHPQGVLLDLMLPKMNGVEILKKIRAQGQFAQIPVIVFTNAYVPNMIQEAFAAGASQVFNKATLSPRQILDSLDQLLNGGAKSAAEVGAPLPQNQPSTTPPRIDPLAALSEGSFHSAPLEYQGSPPPPRAYLPDAELTRPTAHPNPKVPAPALSVHADDAEFQAELYQAFSDAKADTIRTLRKHLSGFTKAPDDASRMPHLLDLYRKVHSLTGSAGIAGYTAISQLTAAVEVLLKELNEKPKNINASTLRTVSSSIDFIGDLFKIDEPQPEPPTSASILVVDDEILSRRAITYALEKASLKSVSIEDPLVAFKLATDNPYDLIFLDVQMPGMDGFELCKKIRLLPTNKHTPVIFVTSLTDFKSRARSSLSGGTDLIAKPFMFIELTVKALTHVIRGRTAVQRKMAA